MCAQPKYALGSLCRDNVDAKKFSECYKRRPQCSWMGTFSTLIPLNAVWFYLCCYQYLKYLIQSSMNALRKAAVTPL